MVAIPGGEFTMGSPAAEKDRRPDEGPQHKVKIDPFWMGKVELSWDIYDLYAFKNMEKEMALRHPDPEKSIAKTDASTRPSPPYVDMSFGMGRAGYPAINMQRFFSVNGCMKKQVFFIASQQKRNGNMPAEPDQKPLIPLAMTLRKLMNLRGIVKTVIQHIKKLVLKSQTHGVYMTCMAM
jgi:hypothetical protein